jgi:hypothetical protein
MYSTVRSTCRTSFSLPSLRHHSSSPAPPTPSACCQAAPLPVPEYLLPSPRHRFSRLAPPSLHHRPPPGPPRPPRKDSRHPTPRCTVPGSATRDAIRDATRDAPRHFRRRVSSYSLCSFGPRPHIPQIARSGRGTAPDINPGVRSSPGILLLTEDVVSKMDRHQCGKPAVPSSKYHISHVLIAEVSAMFLYPYIMIISCSSHGRSRSPLSY